MSKLQSLKGTRDVGAVESALDALTRAAEGNENLLEFAIRAARSNATVGEISYALERAFGRHVATVQTISGVYRQGARRQCRGRRDCRASLMPSRRNRRQGRASSLPRWDRTATTVGRR
ncbi:methylmalonyl-CoA mutase family protein [Mesorhizobium calcicola]|uniref:Methylmalonyl-CoA mutase family protein n=1 Tax=Mesorhizobium calcicola TaxID=1300310 RepID=A0ABW4WKQ4_9HYPH